MPSYEPVTALTRGLEVLEAIACDEAATIKSLHGRTGIPKPTLVRLVETLIHAGYVFSSGERPSYHLTARSLLLSGGVNQTRQLSSIADPILAEFRQAVPWPSDVAVLDRDAMAILKTSRQPGQLSVNRQVGSRVSATRTALGRAFLAHLAPEDRTFHLAELKRLTGDPESCEQFEALLGRVRERGYSWNDRDYLPDIRALAAPIFQGGRVVASINLIVVAASMSLAELEDRYAGRIVGVAAELSAALR